MDIAEILSGKRVSVDEMLAQIDSIRRGLGRNILATLTNPVGHFNQSAARYGEENLPTRSDMSDWRSVMPEVRNQAANKIMDLAMNFGPGSIAKLAPGKQPLLGRFETTTAGRIQNKTNEGVVIRSTCHPV